MLSCVYWSCGDPQVDWFQARSVLWKYSVEVAFSGTDPDMENAPPADAVAIAMGCEKQPGSEYSATVLDGSAVPVMVTCANLDGDGGVIPPNTGAAGGVSSST